MMDKKSSSNTLKDLLDRLAIESWQLELVVSGFAIFLVGSSLEPIRNFGARLIDIQEGLNSNFGILPIIATILLGSVLFVFINLILHIIFRGMWISAIGLRSISGEVDLEELNFVKPFDRFMKSKMSSFDAFVKRLDDISSVIFAVTFLLVFMLISFGLFFLFIGCVIYILNHFRDAYDLSDAPVFVATYASVVFLLVVSGILYFIDFVTLGFLKRKRWIAIWYFPIYRLLSIITFSWLYRPLYYNLIDNKFGRRIGLFLFPYFLIVAGLFTLKADLNLYIPEKAKDLQIYDRYFEDSREESKRINKISIPSKFIDNGYLELFIQYYAPNDDQTIAKLCPNLTPDVVSGIGTDLQFNINGSKDIAQYSPLDSMINCVVSNYEIKINDSLYQGLDFYFYKDPTFEQQGIKTIIDLNHLGRGKHELTIQRYALFGKTDSLGLKTFVTTPFWLE